MPRLMLLTLIAVTLVATGCDSRTAQPGATAANSPAEHSTTPASATSAIPLPVHEFDALCVGTGAEYERVVRIAQARKLAPATPEMLAVATSGADPDSGSGFVVASDPQQTQLLVVAPAKNNTCGLYALGYKADAVEKALIEHFRLFLLAEQSDGTQAQRMFIPGGTSQMQSEAASKGVIVVLRSKDTEFTGDAILLNYIPPAVASQVFK